MPGRGTRPAGDPAETRQETQRPDAHPAPRLAMARLAMRDHAAQAMASGRNPGRPGKFHSSLSKYPRGARGADSPPALAQITP
ncbi:hypothetical protein SAMN04244548_03294 [Paracoccus pantotrophus]|nr:hypothetical protein SAMN04244548_03294 [Paracoccus pantotrophus]